MITRRVSVFREFQQEYSAVTFPKLLAFGLILTLILPDAPGDSCTIAEEAGMGKGVPLTGIEGNPHPYTTSSKPDTGAYEDRSVEPELLKKYAPVL